MDTSSLENPAAASSKKQVLSEIPDGGFRAWIIVVASFLTNGLIFGIHNCYGLIYLQLKNQLEELNIDDAPIKSSLVGSLSIGMTFFISPLAGILIDSFGLRRTAILGGAVASVGMLASSFALQHVEVLYLTYGVLFGAGTSLAYNPSLVILGHYFQERLGFVNGVVTAGSSVFTIVLPFLLDAVIVNVGLAATLQIIAGIMGLLMLCAITFVPRLSPRDDGSNKTQEVILWKKYINFSIWSNKKYVIWAIAVPTSMFGYFVPYVHLVAYVKDILPEADGKLLVLCIGITSGVGRLVFGKIGDLPRVNRVILQQTAFLAIGIFTMLLTLADSFAWLITICLFMGAFDGCFVALVGPIAFDLVGQQNASQAIGFLLGLYSLPMTAGPTVAGALYEALGSYQMPFLLAGCPPILCAFMMLFIHRVKDKKEKSNNNDVIGNPMADITYPVPDMPQEKIQGGYTHSSGQVNINTSDRKRTAFLPKIGQFSSKLFQQPDRSPDNQVSLQAYVSQPSDILW